MSAIKQIHQGGSLPLSFNRGGESLDGWTCLLEVKRFKDDVSAIISRAITADGDEWPTYITQTESAALDVGLHYAIGKLTDTVNDEEQQIPLRFHVLPAWV